MKFFTNIIGNRHSQKNLQVIVMASPTKKLFVIGNYRISCAGCEERTGIVALKQLIKLYVINCKGSVEWQHEDPQHLIVRDAIG
ncbi:MAG: hypothetical protein QNI92_18195, partial [Desulfobacterales bacterium]|nr:hypothetical protein [Desulfobacterales bacterium]